MLKTSSNARESNCLSSTLSFSKGSEDVSGLGGCLAAESCLGLSDCSWANFMLSFVTFACKFKLFYLREMSSLVISPEGPLLASCCNLMTFWRYYSISLNIWAPSFTRFWISSFRNSFSASSSASLILSLEVVVLAPECCDSTNVERRLTISLLYSIIFSWFPYLFSSCFFSLSISS